MAGSHRTDNGAMITVPRHRCRGKGTRPRAAACPAGSVPATDRCRAANPGPARRPNRCGRPDPLAEEHADPGTIRSGPDVGSLPPKRFLVLVVLLPRLPILVA